MKISRIKFVSLFILGAVAFLVATTVLLDQPTESLLGSDSQLAWKATVSNILSPIKVILVGPVLPFTEFLHQDPDTPPPFFIIGFVFYWIILALFLYKIVIKRRYFNQRVDRR